MMRRGPHFTEAARAAAAAKRRERAGLAAMTFDMPTVFVVRADESGMRFTWEIRRFGGITLHRSDDSFPTGAAARQAGLAALDRLHVRMLPEQAPDIEYA